MNTTVPDQIDKLFACLSDTLPVPGWLLKERLARPPHAITDPEQQERLINAALNLNEIRHLEGLGYLRGGRPQ